jgi:hypothetical protein
MIYALTLLIILCSYLATLHHRKVVRVGFHCDGTTIMNRCLGPHILKTRRRMLSMYLHRITLSLDLWWVTLWISIDWDVYV